MALQSADRTSANGHIFPNGYIRTRTQKPANLASELLRCAGIAAAGMMLAGPARAQDATWSTTPFSNDYGLNLNWVPTGPPPGTATFGASSVTSLVSNGNVTHQAMVLNAGAANYTITNNFFYSLTGGAGVTINGGSLHFINNLLLSLGGNASLGAATVANAAAVTFGQNATAGNSTITGTGNVVFSNSSTAGNASISSSQVIGFNDTSSMGAATLTSLGGQIQVNGSPTDSTARIILTGGQLFMQNMVAPSLTIGSVEGDAAGTVTLGNHSLIVGSNNLSSNFAGVIENGVGAGSLQKIGTGTLTLGGTNTYSGGTTLTSGTLAIQNAAALGTGNVTFGNGTLRSDITTTVTNGFVVGTGATGTISAANGQTLTLTGAVSLQPNATALQFGTVGGTGVVNADFGLGVFNAPSAYNLNILGGTFRTNTSVGNALMFEASATNVSAGATVEATATGFTGIRNLQSAGNLVINTPTAFRIGGGVQSGNISGTAGLTVATPNTLGLFAIQNSGLFVFSGTGTHSGGTTIQNGATLQLGNGRTTGSIIGDVVNTGTLAFNRSNAYQFDGIISGTGALQQNGTGLTNLTGANTYTGATTVNAGTLAVNGSTATSASTVNAGGTLGGTGTVGNTSINGGTLAPGNSVGTLTVQGNLVLSTAATYLVEIAGANADRTNVTGTANPGGARLSVNAAAGAANRRYTILTATGGVTGTFGSITAPNLIATLNYDPSNVFLDIRAALGLGTPLNQNQQAVAGGINTAFNGGGALPPGFINLFNLSGANLATALTQLSGEAATGVQQTTFNAMDMFLGVMTDPFMGTRSGGTAGAGAAGYADEAMAYAAKRTGRTPAERDAYAKMALKAPPLAAAFERRWSVWGAGYGGTSNTDGNAAVGSSDTRARIYGGAAGLDYRLAPDTLVGFSLGGAASDYNLTTGLGGGRSEMFQAGIYGRHFAGPAYIAAALAYAWQDVTTDRIALLNSYRANFDADAISGRLEGGWRFALGNSGLTPYAAGQFTTFFLPNYAEQTIAGVNTFALAYGEQDVTASRTELGLRADTSFASADAIVTLRGRAAWAHNFNVDRSIGAIFQTLPGSAFTVNGAAQARDSALVSAGAEARWLNGWSVAATFEGEFSNVTESYAGKGVVRYHW